METFYSMENKIPPKICLKNPDPNMQAFYKN